MSSLTSRTSESPWHDGELAIQKHVGVLEKMAVVGKRNIRHQLTQQHREFYPLLPFIVMGTVDAKGHAWATLLGGHPGFLSCPDDRTLHVESRLDPMDPAAPGLRDGDAVGLLGMQLETRRRNRLNGAIHRTGPDRFDVAVEDSFGNCDRYITMRQHSFAREPAAPFSGTRKDADHLDERARRLIRNADTLFVASYRDLYLDGDDRKRQVDVSHRGGKAGFVDVDANGVLSIPDFNGNGFFNTLGNILKNPECGLLFVDFETGDMLQMAGEGSVILEGPEVAAFHGAERLWRFRPRHVVYRANAFPVRFAADASGVSPHVLLTGNWKEAAARLQAEAPKVAWRAFRICDIRQESSSIRSFSLEPADGGARMPYQPGQYLPIRVKPAGHAQPLVRTYTLSSAPADAHYRISVKAAGAASRYLHGLQVGDMIEAQAPAGSFVLDAAGRRPIVLLAAGVGITPMISMLRHLAAQGQRPDAARKVWLFYGAGSKEERAFDEELTALQDRAPACMEVVRAMTRVSGERGVDYEVAGHLTMATLKSFLPFDDYEFYLCGPGTFMQNFYDGLRQMNIADERIHFEAFGPASIRRQRDAMQVPGLVPASIPGSIPVMFTRSKKTASWTLAAGSLLELAESVELSPAFSCRGGSCGTCRTRVVSGSVRYASKPDADHDDAHALICCATPVADTAQPLALDL